MINFFKAPLLRPALLLSVLLLTACGSRYGATVAMPEDLNLVKLDTSGFTEQQRSALVDRLQSAGTMIADEAESDVPTLSVRLGELREFGLINGIHKRYQKKLVQEMFYQVNAADDTLLKPERRLRHESVQGIYQYNPRHVEARKQKLQAQMQNVMASRMIYQLQQM